MHPHSIPSLEYTRRVVTEPTPNYPARVGQLEALLWLVGLNVRIGREHGAHAAALRRIEELVARAEETCL